MKKVLLVFALCGAVAIANAQEVKTLPVKAKVEQVAPMPVKTVIAEAELLQPIKDNIAKDFTGSKFERAIKMENKGIVNYNVMIKKDNIMFNLLYDKNGKLVKKEEIKGREPMKVDMKKTGNIKATEQLKK